MIKIPFGDRRHLEVQECGKSINLTIVEEGWSGAQRDTTYTKLQLDQGQAYMLGDMLKTWAEKKANEW
jgi:hypothetical protein